MRILVFGDSIGEGFYDLKKGGWVNRLKLHYFRKGFDIEVTNASIAGYSSKNISDHFENILHAFTARQEGKEKETIVLFAIGINDSCFFDKKLLVQNVSLQLFEENIQKTLRMVKEKSWIKKVFFVNNILVDESKLNPASWGEYYYKNEEIRKYNQLLKSISEEKNIEIIDIENILDIKYLPDGIHPDAKGHKILYQTIKKYLSF